MNAQPEEVYTDDGESLDPMKIYKLLLTNEKPGGHGDRAHAIGAIDMAVWDVIAKLEEKPLYKVISERYNGGAYDEKVYTYAAGGYYYPDGTMQDLKDEIKGHLGNGFRDVKMKVGGAPLKDDLARIEAVLSELDNDGARLMVDINGKFDLRQAIEFALAIKPYKLKWMEEPLDPLDYASHAALADYYAYPMATGEPVFVCRSAQYEPARGAGARTGISFSGPAAQLRPDGVLKDYGLHEGSRLGQNAADSQAQPVLHSLASGLHSRQRKLSGRLSAFRRTADGTRSKRAREETRSARLRHRLKSIFGPL
jgi:hypothetical protein